MTHSVTAKDGTRITYENLGSGPPLVLVWGAMGALDSPFTKAMRGELSKNFTVYDYDRCGRGESGDRAVYSVAHEIEDLRAVCEAAGDPFVWATSSGAALALEAAAAGVPMRMLAAHEPPYMVGEHMERFDKAYERNVTRLVDEGKRGEAVSCRIAQGRSHRSRATRARRAPRRTSQAKPWREARRAAAGARRAHAVSDVLEFAPLFATR